MSDRMISKYLKYITKNGLFVEVLKVSTNKPNVIGIITQENGERVVSTWDIYGKHENENLNLFLYLPSIYVNIYVDKEYNSSYIIQSRKTENDARYANDLHINNEYYVGLGKINFL